MKTKLYAIVALSTMLSFFSCSNYLDIDPEELNTIEKVFSSRTETIKWYNTLYNDNNSTTNHWYVQNIHTADQIPYFWCDDDAINLLSSGLSNVSKGLTSPENPNPAGKDLYSMYYKGIRHANIFLENIDQCQEMGELEKRRYIAEARFMRAMFHFWVLRMHGPIRIQDSSISVSEVTNQYPRNTLDDCVKWILSEFEFAINNGLNQTQSNEELGFPTIGAAKAMKSRLLLLAASQLYNGNATFKNWTNKDGTPLLYAQYDRERWKAAADAAKEVIDMPIYSLKMPSDPKDFMNVVDNYRSITTTWNDEIIWGQPSTTQWYSRNSMPGAWYGWNARNSVTIDLVNDYFMADGSVARPLEEWFANKQFSTADGNGTKANTFWMFVGREARFYASLHFPNQYLTYAYSTTSADKRWKYVDFWYAGESGYSHTPGDKNSSGFSVRKNIPMDMQTDKETSSDTWNLKIPFPHIRLGEIYLNYCEAINEYEGQGGHAKLLPYLNQIRNRVGLPSYTGNYTQDEMREMIRHERRLELAFECQRFFDVRRWFIGHGPSGLFNQPAYGLDMTRGEHATDPSFFSLVKLQDRVFRLEHYFLPIASSEVTMNTELVQAPFY